MELKLETKGAKNIRKTPIVQQTAFWSEVKRKQGLDSTAFEIKLNASELYDESRHSVYAADDILIIFRGIGDDYSVGYVPYGPALDPGEENQGLFLEELSESLRPHLPAECVAMRYDLLWESFWAGDDMYYDDYGNWTGPPAKVNQEIRLNFETHNWNLKKTYTNILPSDTVFIDLRKSEHALMSDMAPKTRYNIRLSLRKGVRVRRAGPDEIGVWYELYRETCGRNRIVLNSREYFETVMGTQVRGSSNAEVELLIAELNSVPLAAMILVYSGPRATYLYGASSSSSRNYMATYALQWEAIRSAKQRGSTEYDMFGVAPCPDPSHPLYGLYRFKTGFGGYLFHRMGCWDYPLDPDNYEMYLASEMNSAGFHLS